MLYCRVPEVKDSLSCPPGPFLVEKGLYLFTWLQRNCSPRGREFFLSMYSQTPLLQAGQPSSLVGEEITELCGLLAIFKC